MHTLGHQIFSEYHHALTGIPSEKCMVDCEYDRVHFHKLRCLCHHWNIYSHEGSMVYMVHHWSNVSVCYGMVLIHSHNLELDSVAVLKQFPHFLFAPNNKNACRTNSKVSIFTALMSIPAATVILYV